MQPSRTAGRKQKCKLSKSKRADSNGIFDIDLNLKFSCPYRLTRPDFLMTVASERGGPDRFSKGEKKKLTAKWWRWGTAVAILMSRYHVITRISLFPPWIFMFTARCANHESNTPEFGVNWQLSGPARDTKWNWREHEKRSKSFPLPYSR